MTLDCLASLAQLNYRNYRIIVVDNDSNDGTAEAVRQRYPVTVIENGANLGFAEGNNIGIARALADGADYILLLNNDTIVGPEMLQELIEVAESGADIGIVGPVVYYFDDPEVIWSAGNAVDTTTGEVRRLLAHTRGGPGVAPYEADYITGCALCIKRQVIERIGLMDARYFLYYEEVDWCTRARESGYRVVVVPKAPIWHKVSATIKQNSPAIAYYMTRNIFLLLKKNSRGYNRARILTMAYLRHLRILAAHTLRALNRPSGFNRRARTLGLRDAFLGRWGKMGADVAAVCLTPKASKDAGKVRAEVRLDGVEAS